MVVRFIVHATQIYKLHGNRLDADDNGKVDFYDVMIYIQWILIVFGLITVVICLTLYYGLSVLVFKETKENIFLHLEGNNQVYDNFYQVTFTRGILKLDFIVNLEFFTSFVVIMISDKKTQPSSIHAWAILAGLFVALILCNILGGCATILSARRRMYQAYFFLRGLVELVKMVALFLLWFNSSIFGDKIDSDKSEHARKYTEFKWSLGISLLLTMITFVWCVRLINSA